MILSCKVYAISKQAIEQLGSSFGFLLVLFAMKISAGHTHIVARGNPQPVALRDSPEQEIHKTKGFEVMTLN